jgi:hypothetical protein
LREEEIYLINIKHDLKKKKGFGSSKIDKVFKSKDNINTKRWHKMFSRSKLLCERSSYISKLRNSFRAFDEDPKTKFSTN